MSGGMAQKEYRSEYGEWKWCKYSTNLKFSNKFKNYFKMKASVDSKTKHVIF